MHGEVIQNKPGRCPKCGMRLVPAGELNKNHTDSEDKGLGKVTWKGYAPLFVILSLIALVSITIAYIDFQTNMFSIQRFVTYYMSGFFIVFSGFKLIDLHGFAQGYSTYDLLAQKIEQYGYIYPFIELFFGLSMILNFFPKQILIIEIAIMSFSGMGVLLKLAKKEKFQCSCLGTFLKVPLTKITLIEDFGMAALAAFLFFSSK